jgi:hypothetical protein
VQAVADGDYAHCVKTLRYVGICELDQRESPLEEVYPPELDRVLSNLPALFSNLHHLAVGFPYDDEFAERWSEEFCDEFERSEQIALCWREVFHLARLYGRELQSYHLNPFD